MNMRYFAAFLSIFIHLMIGFSIWFAISQKESSMSPIVFTIEFTQKIQKQKPHENPTVENQKEMRPTDPLKPSPLKETPPAKIETPAMQQNKAMPTKDEKAPTQEEPSLPTLEIPFVKLSQGLALVYPLYPEAALRFGYEEQIQLKIYILPSGSVSKLEILGKNKPQQIFIDSVSTAMRQWKFPVSDNDKIRTTQKTINFIAGEVE